MAAVLAGAGTAPTVVNCYQFLDIVFAHCGLNDYTEGLYTDAADTYTAAQRRQLNYLLDEVGCTTNSRLLDIGCGAGTLLQAAEQRGARAVGLTVSPAQATRCQAKGLDVRLVDYRDTLTSGLGRFDCIVANGSLEHFVQVADAVAGHANRIYADFFRICHQLLDPTSPARRLATTVIHAGPTFTIDLRDVLRSPFALPWGSRAFHCALLEKIMGACPPQIGQLEACASRWFTARRTVDGTDDYRRTSEEWLRRANRTLFGSPKAFAVWRDLIPCFLAKPRHTALSLFGYLVARSWNWQFQGAQPPMRLLRHTWQAI